MDEKKLNGKKIRRHELVIIGVIFVIYFLIQLHTLSNPAYEVMDDWRQTDTYSMALNYMQYDMNPFRPQFNYDGTGNIYIQLELQIVPYISALIFLLFGFTSTVVPRLLSLLFYFGSAYFLYSVTRRFTSLIPSVMGLLLYLFMPISLLYSRAIMPEACAVFFYCGSVYFLLDWYMEGSKRGIWLSAVFMAFAILEKIPAAFAGILVLAAFFWREKTRCLRTKEFWGYGAISLGLPVIYYAASSLMSSTRYVDGIASEHIFKELFALFTPEAVSFFKTSIPQYFGLGITVFAAAAFFVCLTRDRMPLAVWAAAFALEMGTIVAIIKFGYYMIFTAPVLAVLCAVLLNDLKRVNRLMPAVCFVILFGLTLYRGIPFWRTSTVENDTIAHVAAAMEDVSLPEDVFAVSAMSPAYLNAANRHGYRANIKYHDYIPEGPEAETEYYIDNGVSYFVVIWGAVYDDPNGEYLTYLNESFPIVHQDGYCTIYDMRRN